MAYIKIGIMLLLLSAGAQAQTFRGMVQPEENAEEIPVAADRCAAHL
jgi:hypothetical protein